MKISIVRKFYVNSADSFVVRYVNGNFKEVCIKMMEEYIAEVKAYRDDEKKKLDDAWDVYSEKAVKDYIRSHKRNVDLANVIIGDIEDASMADFLLMRDELGIKNYSMSIREVELEEL